MSGQHHRARAGWVYSRRPRGICQGCEEPKVLDRQGLVINHRERVDGRPGLLRCTGSGHTPSRYLEEETVTDTAHPTMPPNAPGARDECATCGHGRYRHAPDQPDGHGAPPCERATCACGGHFVELSQATRMARFVEAAQDVAGAMFTVRTAMTEAFRAFHSLHSAMQAAGLLPEEEPHLCDGCDSTDHPVTATDDGRALLCPSCHHIPKDQSIPLEASQPGGRHQRDSVCPLDGQPLEEVRMEDGKPTVYVHADGITHLDRLPDLEEARRHEAARLAEALDIPPEMITGTPGVQHWTAWDLLYGGQPTQPPEPTDMETTQTIPPYRPGHRSDCHATCDGTLCGPVMGTHQEPGYPPGRGPIRYPRSDEEATLDGATD